MSRQIFFRSLNGFDTHNDQLATQDVLLAQVSPAISAFYTATQELLVDQQMTTFTESEFARTCQPSSGGGSDHAWGGHHVVVGGAVAGGDMYGQYPTIALNGPDDASGRGVWVPIDSARSVWRDVGFVVRSRRGKPGDGISEPGKFHSPEFRIFRLKERVVH